MTLTPEKRWPTDETAGTEAVASAHRPEDAPRRGRPVELVIDLRDAGTLSRPDLRRGLPHRYDIHGIVSVGSAVRLPELETFRSDDVSEFDIEIRAGRVGRGSPRRRTMVTQYMTPAAVTYQEHLGRAGADFSVELGEPIRIVVGPWLVRSPHVLYTNIVEALLRFVMVSVLTGVVSGFLPAWRLLRENNSRFLSDDMTIVSPDGTALTYPKPLTISEHTLRAVNAGDLSKREWRRLRVQSRLHSKEGRGIGARLGDMNVPIMSLNAVTQFVVPPPKYTVERLVPTTHTRTVKVEELLEKIK